MSAGDEDTKVPIIYGDLGPEQGFSWKDKLADVGSAANLHNPSRKDRKSNSCSLDLGVQAELSKEL